MPADFIETFTGKRFRPLAPVSADIDLKDIAQALSHQCRFQGHVRDFYSVAEHSVRVSWLVEEWGHDVTTQLWALLHDASEAYLQDVARPLKVQPVFGPYRDAEDHLMRVIAHHFELPGAQPEAVTKADYIMCATEARDLMPFVPEHWADMVAKFPPVPEPYRITPWVPREARRKFFNRFTTLRWRLLTEGKA
jgi:uncharacterized protein